jgi:hypothetical protein
MDDVRKVMLEAISQRFSNNFVADIAKADWTEIFGSSRSNNFRN